MKTLVWVAGLALACAGVTRAGSEFVVYRLASLPASVEPGQKLVLCAANIGTGPVSVTLEFVNVKTGGATAEKTVRLEPLGAGAGSQPCVTAAAETVTAARGPAAASEPGALAFTAGGAAAPAGQSEPVVAGVALVRKSWLSFRQAQVTASIQVMAPDQRGVMRTIQTIPLTRTEHPADGAPVYAAPADGGGGHHK